ncbi:MAG: hypothetical protein ACYC7L_14395 [Nitrospirota bacterium]
MDGRVTYMLRLSVLVLYCFYAVSPVYLTSAAGRGARLAECGYGDSNVTCGIVWINVLLSGLVPAHQDAPAATMELAADEHDREFILVKNKRAVLRERVQLRPALVLQAAGPAADVPHAKPFFVDSAPLRSNFRYDDLLTFCHGGLSPPVPFA